MTTGRRIEGTMPVAFRYTPGVGAGAFLAGLGDRELRGSRCAACGVTYLPARAFCERCLAALAPEVRCGPEGTLVSATAVHVDVDGRSLPDAGGLRPRPFRRRGHGDAPALARPRRGTHR